MSAGIVSHVLERIPFEPDVPEVLRQARVMPGSEMADELVELAAVASQLARPKALYLVAYVSERGEDYVEVEGCRFTSSVLRVNLDQAHRVFPYLATCGWELHQWAEGISDPLQRYWADVVKQLALVHALRALDDHIATMYAPGDTSAMNPGSLHDWPIEQQAALFDLLGATVRAIGVQLTASMLMIPNKTVSGIRFPTTAHFESCQLCPRENCPGRRTPFDSTLSNTKYAATSHHVA
jgi:hypothetical protein